MLKIPPNDILIIGLAITVIGGLILSINYFGFDVNKMSLEGRMQLGGNSFDMKNKIIAKYHAVVGFTLIVIGFILNLIYILFLQRYITYSDLRGRSVFFGSMLNILTTVAVLFVIFRGSLFLTHYLSRRVYYPFLQKRELSNFNNTVEDYAGKKDNKEILKDTKKGIDQLLALFDIKVRKNYTYDMKIKELRKKVFKENN